MKAFNFKYLAILAAAGSLAVGSLVYADQSSSSSAPGAPGSGQHHKHHKGPVGQALHGAFKSCKAAGVDHKACAQQLVTYLADFKPSD